MPRLWYTEIEMKLLVLYRPNSEMSRTIEEFVRGLQDRHGLGEHQLQVMDYDSREGSALASLYDVTAQPVLLVLGNDGGYVKHWQGDALPLMDEVAGYVLSYQ